MKTERVARFSAAVERVGGAVTIVGEKDAAAEAIKEVLGDGQSGPAGRIAASESPLVHSVLSRSFSHADVDYEVPADALFAYHAGVTGAQWAMADTGTIVLDSAAERHRLLSLVPPVHVALLEAARIRDTLADVLTELHAPGQPVSPAITFITGPSRTSDIELVPVVGVHGPRVLHVILIDQ